MRGIIAIMTTAAMLPLATVGPALAHRERGTGGRVWVTEERPQAGYLVVLGGIRQKNRTGEDLELRCRIQVTTTEGRTGATWRKMQVPDGGAEVKKWRVLVTDSSPTATASDVHVPHCHIVD